MTVALVIEDDQTHLDLLHERLFSIGHVCRKARSQAEADEMLDAYTFDYILLDVEIPGRPGSAADIAYGQNLLRSIRERPEHNRTPVIAMTGYGLDSYHLCIEMIRLGANDFLGKPFGRGNVLENRILELLRHFGERNGSGKTAPEKLTKFEGGDLVFYPDRIELCGVKICRGKDSSIKRRVLDMLRHRNAKGAFRCFPMKDIAESLRLDRPGAVAEAIADLRKDCRERLREKAGIDCQDEDLVSNRNRGYHLRDWIRTFDGNDDDLEPAAAMDAVALTQYQRRILRLLETHPALSPRKISDGLGLPEAAVAKELDDLFKAGLILGEGYGSNRKVKLAKNAVPVQPLLPSLA
jgi:DNA-binding response OmpR family regulator